MEDNTLTAGLAPDQIDEVSTIDNQSVALEPTAEQSLPEPVEDVDLSEQTPMADELGKGITSAITEEPMVNELDVEFQRKAVEDELQYQQDHRKWQTEGYNSVHDTIQNFDSWDEGEDEEVKQLKVVRSILTLDGSPEPKDMAAVDLKSSLYAKKHFNKDIDTASELFQLVKGRSDERKVVEDKDNAMRGQALLGTMDGRHFGDWAAQQGYTDEDAQFDDNVKYNEFQKKAREQFPVEIEAVKGLFSVLKRSGGQAMLEYAYEQKLDMTDDQYENFKSLFREVILNNKDESKEDYINKAFGTDIEAVRKAGDWIGKRVQTNQRMIDAATIDMFNFPVQYLEQLAVTGGAVGSQPLPFGGGFQMTAGADMDERMESSMEVKRRQAILNDLRGTLRADYAPMEMIFERGGEGFWGGVEDKLGFIEENAVAMPSTLMSMVMVATPGVGIPMVASMMHGSNAQEYRQELVSNGVPLNEAIRIADEWAVAATVPQLVMEKLQNLGLSNRIPFLKDAVNKVTAKFTSKRAMAAVAGGANLAAEGLIETGQNNITGMVQMLAHEFESRMPDREFYNGKDGVFDGWWGQYAASLIQVAPAGISSGMAQKGSVEAAMARKEMSYDERTMIGISKEDNDAYEAATTTGEIFGVYKNVEPNRDPYSDESKAKVEEFVEEQKAKQERTNQAVANLTEKGVFPIIRTDKTQQGVVELVHPETGDILTRTDDPRVAADSVVAHLELDDQVNQDRMDELVGMIETAVLDVQDTAYEKGKVSLELGELMDVGRILAMYPEFESRAMSQVDRLENLESREIINGGDGRMTRAVYGMSVAENEADQKGFLQRIFGGRTNAMTLVHERGHAKFREALDSGAITLKEAFDFFTNLDKALEGKTDRKGQRLSFLPEGATESDFASIDEAVAEFHEVMLLRTRNGKKSKMREAVGRQLSAMVKAQTPGATKLKAFYDAMQDFFSKLLARNLYMKQAVKQGLLNESDVEKFRMALQGTTEQEAFETEVEQEASEIMDVPFSIGAEANADYLSAVESGDVETAQSMVDEVANIPLPKLSKQLIDEIDDAVIRFNEDGETVTRWGVLQQLMEEGDFKRELDNLQAELGVSEGLTKDEVDKIQSSHGGKKYDFKRGDTYYVFRSWDVMPYSNDQGTYDADGNVIPLSQRFDAGRDEVSLSIGDTQMKDTLWTQAWTRAKSPEKRMTVMKNLMDRLEALRRDVPRIIKAFGKEYTQQAIVDRRMVGELRADASKMRRELIEEAENEVYDKYGEILSNEDIVSLKSQPVTDLIITEGGIESLTSAKRRNNDDQLKAGEFEAASGLPVMYYGGSRTPDQMAQELYNEGLISDDSVETMMEAIDAEMVSVSTRKEELAVAKKSIVAAKKAARKKSDEWLEERLAEQERDYNVMARAHRALVTFEAIRMSLPMELRGKIKGDAKLLSIKSDEKRLEYLEDAIAKLDKIVDTWIKKETTKEINTAFDRILKLKKGSNVRKSKTVAEIHAEVKLIKGISKLTGDEVNAKLEEINKEMQLTQDGDAQGKLELDMVRLITFGNMKEKNGSQLTDYLANVLELERSGLLKREVLDQKEREELQADIDLTNNEVTGGKGRMLPSEQSIKGEKETTEMLAGLKKTAGKLHTHNVSFEWIMNILSRRSGTETLKGGIHRRFAVMAHKSTKQEDVLNMNASREQDEFFKSLFGVKGKNKLSQAINDHLLKRKKTGIFREFYRDGGSVKKQMKVSNIVAIIEGRADAASLGLSEAEVESAKADYYAKLNKKQSQKNMKGKVATLNGNTNITYETTPEGVKDELVVSQSQAVAYIMMFRQEGMRESMIREGYTEETMAQLENEFLTPKAKVLMSWLTQKYDENYDVVNAVFRAENGIDLPKIDFYSPLKRIAEGKVKDLTIEGDKQALSTTPAFVFDRTRNFAEMDTEADALSIFNNHILQTNHYVSWAKTIKRLRGVFQNTDVQRNIKDYVGDYANTIIQDRINWQADGGNRNATQWSAVNKLRSGFTLSALSWNPSIGYKQLSSAPAFINEMGFSNFVKYQTLFFKDFRKNLKEMWETNYVQTRFKEGYDREVKDALRVKGKSKISRFSVSALQDGMIFTKLGDIIPVIAGGWAMKQYTYDKSLATMTHADAEAEAMLQFEMVTDRYQQASSAKDFNTFQGGGSVTRLFTMFLTSPNQYYAGVAESLLDWKAGRKGGRERAIRSIIVGHVILPTMFRLATDSWRHVFDEEDHEWSINEYGKAMLLGGFNGLIGVGIAASSLAAAVTGAKVWDVSTPWGDIIDDLADGMNSMSEGDVLDSVDSILEGVGKVAPSPATFYPIIKRRTDWLYD